MLKLAKALLGILIAAGIFTAIDVNNTVTDEVREKYGFVTVQEQTIKAETAGAGSDDGIVAIIRNKKPKKAEAETTEPSSETFRSGQMSKSGKQETEEDETVRKTETSAAETATTVSADTVRKIIERETERETTSTSSRRETEPVTEAVRNKEPETTAHVHSWQEMNETIYHDTETKDVWIIDNAAYDETVTYDEPVYDEHLVIIATCRGCGAQFTGDTQDEVIGACGLHIIYDHDNACGYGLEDSYWESIQTGTVKRTKTIHHEEQGHWETVVVKEGYNEIRVTGYICSECGAEK